MGFRFCLRAGLALLVVAAAAVLLPFRAPTAPALPPAAPPGFEKIQHFVFIMQENRSFDQNMAQLAFQ
jgi:phospholipase C